MTGNFPGIPEHALDVLQPFATDAGLVAAERDGILEASVLGGLQRLERALIGREGPLVEPFLLLF